MCLCAMVQSVHRVLHYSLPHLTPGSGSVGNCVHPGVIFFLVGNLFPLLLPFPPLYLVFPQLLLPAFLWPHYLWAPE